MSKGKEWEDVCQPGAAVNVDFATYCSRASTRAQAPIDTYITYTSELMKLADPTALNKHDILSRLIMLGAVGAAEHYFRTVLALVVRICPTARDKVGTKSITIATVDYYGLDDIGLSVFGKESLAGRHAIVQWTEDLTGIRILRQDDVDAALVQYDRVCQLRHAAVHAGGELTPGNLEKIGAAATGRAALKIDFGGVQAAVAICTGAVRTYNQFLYKKIITAWLREKYLTGDFAKDRKLFGAIYEVFACAQDGCKRAVDDAYLSLRPTIASSLLGQPK